MLQILRREAHGSLKSAHCLSAPALLDGQIVDYATVAGGLAGYAQCVS
jgi:hypothetical protein